MVGCHVSVSSHVMPLPALVHSLVTNLSLTLEGAARPTAPIEKVLGKSLAHATHCFPASMMSKTGLASNEGTRPPRACEMSATSLPLSPWPSPCIRPRQTEADGLVEAELLLFKAILHLSLLSKAAILGRF